MSQTVTSILMGLALVASACGGFDNTPFRTGNVRGRLTEADPAVAVVSLVGNPEVRSTVAGDGSFLLERVPAGPVELFIIASANKAVRMPVVVPGGDSARLQDVQPRAAGFLKLKVRAPARQWVGGGKVSVTGTPLQLQLAEDGSVRVGPLPEGCYALETSVPGFPVKRTNACVGESEQREVEIELPEPNENADNHGCAHAGCVSNGQDRQNGPVGSSCDEDSRCRERGLAQGVCIEGACTFACTSDAACPEGFACAASHAGSVCQRR